MHVILLPTDDVAWGKECQLTKQLEIEPSWASENEFLLAPRLVSFMEKKFTTT